MAMMAVERSAAHETKRKKIGNTPCVCEEKEHKESFDLKLVWVSSLFCLLTDFWRSSRIQPWGKPPSDLWATSPVGLSVCGENSGHEVGSAVYLTAWTSSQSEVLKARPGRLSVSPTQWYFL